VSLTSPLVADGVTRRFSGPDGPVLAVDDVTLSVPRGSTTAIVGPSGSGKSTLLQLLAALDRPDAGTVEIDGTDIATLADRELSRLRRQSIGFVFQSFNLVSSLDARANIMLPLELDGRRPDAERFDLLVEALGIADRLHHRPGQLSGGQQQRVAVARALLPAPAVVLADEPTGSLDAASAARLLDLLTSTADELDQTLLIVTHDDAVASRADQVWTMTDGRLTVA